LQCFGGSSYNANEMAELNESGSRAAGANEHDISVHTDGYEGRFLQWNGEAWQAFEYANFRHWFSPPEPLTPADFLALRRTFHVRDEIADHDLLNTAPCTLRENDSKGRQT